MKKVEKDKTAILSEDELDKVSGGNEIADNGDLKINQNNFDTSIKLNNIEFTTKIQTNKSDFDTTINFNNFDTSIKINNNSDIKALKNN